MSITLIQFPITVLTTKAIITAITIITTTTTLIPPNHQDQYHHHHHITINFNHMICKIITCQIHKQQDFIFLDVRDAHEWQISDIGVATHHIPKSQILEHLGELDTAREIVVYCKTGGRSADVTKLLTEHGYSRVKNMSGGINRWARVIDTTLPVY